LGGSSLIRTKPLPERTIVLMVQVAIVTGLLASLTTLGLMLSWGTHHVVIPLGQWVSIPHYHFVFKFEFDRLSVPIVILTFGLCGTIGAFCNRYLHRESGFNRFFVFYSLFVLGMTVASLAGTIETLFTGWELVGLSSALLIGFYHERVNPVKNGLWVWSVYRVSDAALLLASIVLHHLTGEGDFDKLVGSNLYWPDGITHLSSEHCLIVGVLLLIAAMGKSAMVPFSTWLPRAMEGPTPSSAVFYGALSVHLGAFLLLRVSPLLDKSPALCVMIVVVGLTSALFGTLAARVQTDIKSALSFASLTQVGIVFAEIGMGLRYIALIHILGHACLRTLQFLRAPTILHDYRVIENAIQGRTAEQARMITSTVVPPPRLWLYRLAFERGSLDSILTNCVVSPVLHFFRYCDRLERAWIQYLAGGRLNETSSSTGDDTVVVDNLEELI
jgi:NAD(P)H-quinone oxidoreductase subunit 5